MNLQMHAEDRQIGKKTVRHTHTRISKFAYIAHARTHTHARRHAHTHAGTKHGSIHE